MGKLTNFYISFSNNPNGVFAPGQIISGSVVAELSAPMEMRTLSIGFFGFSYVYWTETTGTGDDQRTDSYYDKENYFNDVVPLFGAGVGGTTENVTMAAGNNVFPFTYQLPAQLPSSFESSLGYVRYFVKATIEKPWKFNHNTKVAFTVLDSLDLNQDPSNRLSVSGTDSKTLCCWCCASGPIEAQVHLDKGGYVPGEFILVSGSVENASSSNLPSTKAILIQAVKYIAGMSSNVIRRNVAQVIGPGCPARQSITWNKEKFQFDVVTPSGSFDLRLNVPVNIGTIPLHDIPAQPVPGPSTVQLIAPPLTGPNASGPSYPNAPALPQSSTAGPSNFVAPPPTYAAASGAAVNIKDTDDNDYLMGQTTYTPQYVYYDWSQSAFANSNQQPGSQPS